MKENKNQKKKPEVLGMKNKKGITLIALIITIIVLLILAGVSLNAIIGDNGVITNAQKAKIEAEEAELWEKVQMVLVEGMGQDLDREKYVDEVNNKFKNQGLEAKIGLRTDGYAVTYGKYSRKVALLSDDLQILGEIVAIEGSNEVWTFEIKDDGTLKLTGYNKDKVGEIQIPNIIDGKFVTEIGKGLFMSSEITSVNIPEGIERIDEEAFYSCTNLNCKIIFPSSLKEIRDSAFYGCVEIVGNLNSIVSQGIKTGKNAFAKCSKMTGDIKVLIDTLPDDVTEITDEQFSGFSGVTGTLTIPKRITRIGNNAFSNCSGIEELEFDDESELLEIGENAFHGCSSISNKLAIPSKLNKLGAYAFDSCTSLSGVEFNNSLAEISECCFQDCKGIVSLEVHRDITAIGDDDSSLIFNKGSFRDCSRLESISFSGYSSISIGDLAFYNCGKLKSVEGSDSITSVGKQAFAVCDDLISFSLSNVSTIGERSFNMDTGLTDLPQSQSLTYIGPNAFEGCSGLNCDIIEYLKSSHVTKVESEAFLNCTELSGTFTGSVNNNDSKQIYIGNSAFSGTGVERATELNGKLVEDEYFELDLKENDNFSGTTKFVNSENQEIKRIKIKEGVTKIADSAFSGCSSIEEVIIPDSVTTLGVSIFSSCSSLSEVTLPSNNKIITIPYSMFLRCSSLKNIDLPQYITELKGACFEYSGLTSINLENIKVIRKSSFWR